MNTKVFKTLNNLDLIIKNKKSAVIFEIDPTQANKGYEFTFQFTTKDFYKLLKYIETISNESWSNLIPKEADTMSSDYDEYYDKEFDSNGCLNIEENCLIIERPSLESNRLYKFNKRKMESFIYDFRFVFGIKS